MRFRLPSPARLRRTKLGPLWLAEFLPRVWEALEPEQRTRLVTGTRKKGSTRYLWAPRTRSRERAVDRQLAALGLATTCTCTIRLLTPLGVALLEWSLATGGSLRPDWRRA